MPRAVGLPRGEALDYNVGLGGELLGLRPALVGLQVQDNALLAPVPKKVLGELSVRVSGGRLNLDDLRSKVRQHHGGRRSQASRT